MNLRELNKDSTVKRWVLWIGGLLILALLLTVCLGGGDAKAATISAPRQDREESFTVRLTQMNTTMAVAAQKCWHFGPWEYENRDGFGRLRFGYGKELTACTNLAETKWVALPQYDAYHWLGYWQHDLTDKNRSAFGYSNLYVTTLWKFSFKPAGVPLVHEDRTFRCRLQANNHTAYCTVYH